MDFEVLGEGFLFPEGPIAFPDGSVVFGEILGGALTRVWGGGKREVVANLGGGPNGAALGPDGAVYVCNNGGLAWARRPDGRIQLLGEGTGAEPGRIERVDLATGRHERIYVMAGEHPLRAPNDLVFDRSGGFWFTDLGRNGARSRDKSGLYYARPDGSSIEEVHFGTLSYNGVGLSPDETELYVADTNSARLWKYGLEAPGRIVRPGRRNNPADLAANVVGDRQLDSLAVTESGKVVVGVIQQGGLAEIDPATGEVTLHPIPQERYVTNICFGGPDRRDAFVTLSLTGRVVKTRWHEPGLALNFNPY